tara:strand:- start:354 stop:545 length:192 start_codon:yes stop_codon:yes gene_type:complete
MKNNQNSYIEYNKKMIDKQVLVRSSEGEWVGYVKEVKDKNTFRVLKIKEDELIDVDIFDIRSM